VYHEYWDEYFLSHFQFSDQSRHIIYWLLHVIDNVYRLLRSRFITFNNILNIFLPPLHYVEHTFSRRHFRDCEGQMHFRHIATQPLRRILASHWRRHFTPQTVFTAIGFRRRPASFIKPTARDTLLIEAFRPFSRLRFRHDYAFSIDYWWRHFTHCFSWLFDTLQARLASFSGMPPAAVLQLSPQLIAT